jgi:cold shock CspA family protein
MASGTVLWFNKVKGYGAIEGADGERLHVYRPGLGSEVDAGELFKGVEVEFEVRSCDDGLEAHTLRMAPPPVSGGRARLRRR